MVLENKLKIFMVKLSQRGHSDFHNTTNFRNTIFVTWNPFMLWCWRLVSLKTLDLMTPVNVSLSLRSSFGVWFTSIHPGLNVIHPNGNIFQRFSHTSRTPHRKLVSLLGYGEGVCNSPTVTERSELLQKLQHGWGTIKLTLHGLLLMYLHGYIPVGHPKVTVTQTPIPIPIRTTIIRSSQRAAVLLDLKNVRLTPTTTPIITAHLHPVPSPRLPSLRLPSPRHHQKLVARPRVLWNQNNT